MKIEEMKKKRLEIIMNLDPKGFIRSDNTPTFEQIVSNYPGTNVIFSLLDIQNQRFTMLQNVESLLGYKDHEFTIAAINNSSYESLIHPEDVEHYNRYNQIAYKILQEKKHQLKTLSDYYFISFRIKHKNHSWIRVWRSCYIYELTDEGIPKSQFDIWQLMTGDKEEIVKPLFVTSSSQSHNIFRIFYELNSNEIGIKITENLAKIIEGKMNGLTDFQIKKIYNFSSEKAVTKKLESLWDKIEEFLSKRNSSVREKVYFERKRTSRILYFAKVWGLYPVPVEYLSIYK